MIPKIIHYCWFGGAPLPELAVKCIESWQKYCPDYEIKRWDESNFDFNQNRYCREAYEAKKWAFVSDYARVKVLYEYGGIYMDTDVEVLKNLDIFLKEEAFSGFEDKTHIPTGIMASTAKQPFFKLLIDDYENRKFLNSDGTYDTTTNVITITKYGEQYGLSLDGRKQTVCGFTLYPSDYFCPKSYETGELCITKNTYAIHHFDGSWISERDKWRRGFVYKYHRCFGKFLSGKLSLIAYYMKDGDIKGLVDFIVNKIKG